MSNDHEVTGKTPANLAASNDEFSVWWPSTKHGRNVFTLLLGAFALVGLLREYATIKRFDFEDHILSLLFASAICSGSWYVMIVVIRYLVHWYSEQRK